MSYENGCNIGNEPDCSECAIYERENGRLRKRIAELEAEAAASKREAESLCMSIYRRKYKTTAPDFRLCDSVAGVISQIDNMAAGILEDNERLEAENKRLREVVKHNIDAWRSCDSEVLGICCKDGIQWPYRDELIDENCKALAATQAEKGGE